MRKARVTCSSPDVSGNTTITDDGGRFVFAGLPAGRYTVGASKAAWVAASYGATRPAAARLRHSARRRPEAGHRRSHGARQRDHRRRPRSEQPAGGRHRRCARCGQRSSTASGRSSPPASATTDDRGVYRIFGLAAGDYVVGAAARGSGRGRAAPDERRRRAARGRGESRARLPRPTAAWRSPRPTIPGSHDGVAGGPRVRCAPEKSATASTSRCSSCRRRASKARCRCPKAARLAAPRSI